MQTQKRIIGGRKWVGQKATIDDLRAVVRANITVTIDITANDKDRVGVDVV